MLLLLKLKQEGAALPGVAVLFCPWLDLAELLPSESRTALPPVPSTEEVRICTNADLAGHPLSDPIVDPLSADLTGLPHMLIQAATGDDRLAAAGNTGGQGHRSFCSRGVYWEGMTKWGRRASGRWRAHSILGRANLLSRSPHAIAFQAAAGDDRR
jgi:acetyl esterase/lipase